MNVITTTPVGTTPVGTVPVGTAPAAVTTTPLDPDAPVTTAPAVRSGLPGRRAVLRILMLLGALLSLALGTLVGPASALATAGAATTSASVTIYEGLLNPGQSGRYCYHFGAHVNDGPVAATATASEYNVILTTVSTDLEFRSGTGWVYCSTIKNSSSLETGVTLTARASLAASQSFTTNEGTLAANRTGRYCVKFTHGAQYGPAVASAAASSVNTILTTVSTDLENRQGYGWTYCVTVKNSSSTSTGVTLMIKSGLSDVSNYSGYVGYLAAGANGRYCFNAPAGSLPGAVSAAASDYNTILTTVSTDYENRLNYGHVYCATIHNSSSTGSGVTLMGRDGF